MIGILLHMHNSVRTVLLDGHVGPAPLYEAYLWVCVNAHGFKK